MQNHSRFFLRYFRASNAHTTLFPPAPNLPSPQAVARLCFPFSRPMCFPFFSSSRFLIIFHFVLGIQKCATRGALSVVSLPSTANAFRALDAVSYWPLAFCADAFVKTRLKVHGNTLGFGKVHFRIFHTNIKLNSFYLYAWRVDACVVRCGFDRCFPTPCGVPASPLKMLSVEMFMHFIHFICNTSFDSLHNKLDLICT